MNYEELINSALKKAEEMPANMTFELSDLFEADVWKNVGNYRGSLGTKFRKKIEDESELGIERIEKAARKSNLYVKIR